MQISNRPFASRPNHNHLPVAVKSDLNHRFTYTSYEPLMTKLAQFHVDTAVTEDTQNPDFTFFWPFYAAKGGGKF